MGRPRGKWLRLVCKNCGRVFERPAWEVRRRRKVGCVNNFCNSKCYNEYQRNQKVPRIREMKRLRARRFKLREIGERFGITPQRVHTLLKEGGK